MNNTDNKKNITCYDNPKNQDFLTHLDDLKKVIIKSFLAVIVGLIGCFSFAKYFFQILLNPYVDFYSSQKQIIITHSQLIKSLSPYEALTLSMKVSLIAGLVVSTPYILFHFWKFIKPGLSINEQKYALIGLFLTPLLFCIGAIFCYELVFPIGLKFLWKYTLYLNIYPDWTISYYINFILGFLIGFGLSFELPIIIVFLTKMGILSTDLLIAKRKYSIVFIFIIAALLTPADVCSQWLLGFPMILLYEFSIWLTKILS